MFFVLQGWGSSPTLTICSASPSCRNCWAESTTTPLARPPPEPCLPTWTLRWTAWLCVEPWRVNSSSDGLVSFDSHLQGKIMFINMVHTQFNFRFVQLYQTEIIPDSSEIACTSHFCNWESSTVLMLLNPFIQIGLSLLTHNLSPWLTSYGDLIDDDIVWAG